MKKMLFSIILFVSFTGFSQEMTVVKGIVINADSVAIPNAFLSIKNPVLGRSGYADSTGFFQIEYVKFGDNVLHAVNYKKDSTIYFPFRVTSTDTLDLGKVVLFVADDTLVTRCPPPVILRD
jgi:hypothetical protein